MTEKTKPKRNRKVDYSNDEIKVLVNSFVLHHDYLVGRFSSTITQAQKNERYGKIVQAVNAVSATERSLESIKDKWQTMKKNVKNILATLLAQKKKDLRITGGGEATVSLEDDDVTQKLTELEMLIYPLIPPEHYQGL